MNWKERAATSHYQAAVAIQQALMARNIEEAETGIEELAEALGRSDKVSGMPRNLPAMKPASSRKSAD